MKEEGKESPQTLEKATSMDNSIPIAPDSAETEIEMEESIGKEQPHTPESEQSKRMKKHGHCAPHTPDSNVQTWEQRDRKWRESRYHRSLDMTEKSESQSDWSPVASVSAGSESPRTPISENNKVREEDITPTLEDCTKALAEVAEDTLEKIPAGKNKEYNNEINVGQNRKEKRNDKGRNHRQTDKQRRTTKQSLKKAKRAKKMRIEAETKKAGKSKNYARKSKGNSENMKKKHCLINSKKSRMYINSAFGKQSRISKENSRRNTFR